MFLMILNHYFRKIFSKIKNMCLYKFERKQFQYLQNKLDGESLLILLLLVVKFSESCRNSVLYNSPISDWYNAHWNPFLSHTFHECIHDCQTSQNGHINLVIKQERRYCLGLSRSQDTKVFVTGNENEQFKSKWNRNCNHSYYF